MGFNKNKYFYWYLFKKDLYKVLKSFARYLEVEWDINSSLSLLYFKNNMLFMYIY